MKVCAITTIDNPYDPFTQFDDWFAFDEIQGYHSCAYLGRIAKTSEQLGEVDQAEAVEQAIDEIIKHDPFKIYKKVEKEM